MTSLTKISVVIPVYNGESFIHKSYHSILGQNLDNFEIIYVDNNSTDQSIIKINGLMEKDDRIKLFHETKQGAGATRNKGLSKTTGDYIYMFDVDDEIYPDALNAMINVLNDYPEMDAVFGKMVKSSRGISETVKPEGETNNVIFKDQYYWGLLWFKDLKTVVGPPAFLYRKEVFDRIGAYNTDLRIGQDTAFDIKLGMTSNIAFLDKYVYLYFKHPESNFEQSKKNENQIFHLWNRLVKSHLKFYFEYQTPKEYQEILFRQLFSTMGKVIYYSDSKGKRKEMYSKVLRQTQKIKISLSQKIYLKILVFVPSKLLLKFYVYYLSKWYANAMLTN